MIYLMAGVMQNLTTQDELIDFLNQILEHYDAKERDLEMLTVATQTAVETKQQTLEDKTEKQVGSLKEKYASDLETAKMNLTEELNQYMKKNLWILMLPAILCLILQAIFLVYSLQ